MSAHTPGPWLAMPEECDRPYIRIRGTKIGKRHKIANVLTPIYDGVHEREAEQTRANAQLIAAAPELLEALKDVMERLVDRNETDEAAVSARAAIAKAKGGAA